MLIDDIAKKHAVEIHRTKIGEINVSTAMKEIDAVVGGEGNGGVIYPPVQPGRDALTGMGVILEALAVSGISISEWVGEYPDYVIVKDKIPSQELPLEELGKQLASEFSADSIDQTDGVKILGKGFWVHLRASNTEPIIRISAESESEEKALNYIKKAKEKIGL